MATLDQRVADLEAQLAALNTPTNAAIANQIAALLTAWQASQDQLRAWLAGVAGGGPNNDGSYPLTDASGFTRMVSCPDQMRSDAMRFNGGEKVGAGPFTMLVTEANRAWYIGNTNNPANINIVLPDAPRWSTYTFIQSGSGRLSFSAAKGTIPNRQAFTRSAGKSAITVAICTAINTNGSSEWTLGGDMSAFNA